MTDLQTSNAGLGSSDQAAGLRQLFGEGFARVWCLVSSLPGDPTVMVALGAANALRRAGQRVLLVDEVPLTNRNLLGGTPFPVRYDLGQAFAGSIGIEKVVKPVGDRLWYCVATKLRRAKEDKKARPPTLAQRLQAAGIDIDVEQTTSRGTKMPAYRIRWRDSERPEIVLQHMLIADPDPTPPPEGVSLVPPAPKA